jgi:Holliday junction resolvase RusA-like endonuclease
MPFRLNLVGPVPSKKNLWRPRKGGGMFLDSSVKADIDALILQAKSQWKGPPAEHPEVWIKFFVLDQRSDRDNKLGCILDVLQEAGVIWRDNIARFNGLLVILPAVVGKQEGVIIDLEERQRTI